MTARERSTGVSPGPFRLSVCTFSRTHSHLGADCWRSQVTTLFSPEASLLIAKFCTEFPDLVQAVERRVHRSGEARPALGAASYSFRLHLLFFINEHPRACRSRTTLGRASSSASQTTSAQRSAAGGRRTSLGSSSRETLRTVRALSASHFLFAVLDAV